MLCTFLLRFILGIESRIINVSKWCLNDPVRSKWHVSIDLLAHAICTCHFKGERSMVCKWVLLVHLVMFEMAIVLQSKSIKLFRDVATGPNLSLTTDHMFLLCSLDFGHIQWSGCRNCLDCICCLCWLSVHAGSHSIWRLWFSQGLTIGFQSTITSVDGCCLYIIIHNSVLHRTWL